ncbi:MAG: hypothetical protein JXA54_03760 [Candidatus Heimdallarchaeota archaeon]|nr:hypothetical protein [Candidatus Heimdallarchaeota archaeon]
MEQAQIEKKIITLIGRLETPIITYKPFMKKNGCWIKVIKEPVGDRRPNYCPVGKLVKGQRKAPIIFNGFMGYVKVTSVDYSSIKLKQRIELFVQKRFLGQYTNDGFGRVAWLNCTMANFEPKQISYRKKFKIRKGLGVNYPKPLQRLLIALMLHDFVCTEKHPSKIYYEITIEDEEIREACQNHHNGYAIANQFVPLIKRYDAIASFITRKKALKTISRYDKENGVINFQELAKEIEVRRESAYKLYTFIYHSNALTRIIESMNYQKTSLRTHLLIMVNKAINEYYMGTLKIVNDKIIIKEISESVRKKENPSSTKDAEMHLFPVMSNADLESATSSVNKKAWNIEREETKKN